MTQYIDKDALVAEIDRILGRLTDAAFDSMIGRNLQEVKDFINTLEVKEVDLERYYNEYFKGWSDYDGIGGSVTDQVGICVTLDDIKDACRHFFKLGVKVNNPITSADRGTAEEIIINLKKIESDYNVCLTKEIEWVRKQVGLPELKTRQG